MGSRCVKRNSNILRQGKATQKDNAGVALPILCPIDALKRAGAPIDLM
jgi:hypothetical protein